MSALFTNARSLSERQKSMWVEVLGHVFDNLDLTKSQRERIETAYNTVGEYLASCDDPLLEGAQIYPQGSMRLRTTVKPLSKEEFDVDLILFLPNAGNASREQIVLVIKQYLMDSEVYKKLVEDLPRGFRINYKGDYHLDITPAVEYVEMKLSGHPLWVVDKRNDFKESNPEGMAQVFDKSCSLIPKIQRRQRLLEALSSKSVTELPDQKLKKPLNRIIQILKRHRDVWSQQDKGSHADFKPISVVITTLASRAYVEVMKTEKVYESEFDLILDVIELMPHHIETVGEVVIIANPTMQQENYAEKWNRVEEQEGVKYRQAFFEWHKAAVDMFDHLTSEKNKGLDNVFEVLSGAFGEKPVLAARERIIESVNSNRSNDRLGVVLGTGAITTSISAKAHSASHFVNNVAPVKRNQFYGD